MAVITDKPGQLGFLIANEEGAVVMSGGELENDERIASVIFNLVNVANKKLLLPAGSNENFTRISIHCDNHVYAVTLSNRRLHIVKRKYVPFDPVAA